MKQNAFFRNKELFLICKSTIAHFITFVDKPFSTCSRKRFAQKSQYHLTLNTLRSICKFSILFFIHFLWYWYREFFYQLRVLEFAIISFILITLMFDSGCDTIGRNQMFIILSYSISNISFGCKIRRTTLPVTLETNTAKCTSLKSSHSCESLGGQDDTRKH